MKLSRLIIQRPGRRPPPRITAPHPYREVKVMLTEAERMATFEQSRNTESGKRAEYIKPN